MARSKNILLAGISGHIGQGFVVKQYTNRTVVSIKPDMSNAGKSEAQIVAQSKFKMAQAYAKSILLNPSARLYFEQRLQPGQLVYHAVISAYMKGEIENDQ